MEQPLLVNPKPAEPKIIKRMKTFVRKPDPASIKERITDDQGREIPFKRPNGDKLKSHFIKITAKDNICIAFYSVPSVAYLPKYYRHYIKWVSVQISII